MRKGAIISLYGNNNFGNKLQTYAMQETLKKYGFYVENIINTPYLNNKGNSIFKIIKLYLNLLKKKIKYGIGIHQGLNYKDTKEKQKAFLEFNKYINNTKYFFSFLRIKKFTNYDYYFVGSDQIWNPEMGGLSDLDLLTFTNKKKIAVSASFGIDSIPNEFKEKTKKALGEFDAISVREEKGKEIVQNLTSRNDIEVLVDPTMLLTTDEWNKVCKKPEKFNCEKYILCYFLGDISEERKETIRKFAEENRCEIINIMDSKSEYYSCGPSEFIYLEKNAYMICTDSFHSSIFAILYHIPFIVFQREGSRNNMSSRIFTLLKKFDLENRLYKNNKRLDEYEKIDYYSVEKRIKYEREKAFKFIEINVK